MPEVLDEHRGAVQLVHRNVEIALNLRRVQIEGERAAGACGFEQVRDELGGDRDARFVFAVLTGVAVVRQHGGDAPGGRAFECVVQERLLQVRQEKAQIIELQGLAADAAGTRSIDAQGKKHALTTALMNWDALDAAVQRACALLGALDLAKIPVARNCFANEGAFVLKPDSGSARQRWARENSKHRRTATRQRGFCSSALKQSPLDLSQSRVTPKNRAFKIVGKPASLRAPA